MSKYVKKAPMKNCTIKIDEGTLDAARLMKINISKVSRDAVRKEVKRAQDEQQKRAGA